MKQGQEIGEPSPNEEKNSSKSARGAESGAQQRPTGQDEPNILFQEEDIIVKEEVVEIFDHNNLKIIYDSSIHDFLEIFN